jgi:hypothetical protein
MDCEICPFRLLDAAWIAGRDYFKFLLDWLRNPTRRGRFSKVITASAKRVRACATVPLEACQAGAAQLAQPAC